jgi:hypothetical protein
MPTVLNSNIFGALGIPDDDYSFVLTFGQEAVFDATQQLLGNHNADLGAFESAFVERSTYNHKTRYYLETGGRLQKVTNRTRALDTKAQGNWDVAYPLEEWGARIAGNRVQMAYMSTGQYGRHIQMVLNSDVNTRRFEMLKAIFNNAPPAFLDENWGSLPVQPLANGDATLYPPVVGAEVNATANNYLCTGFAPASISDKNDPISPSVDQIESYFGIPTGGSNVAVFLNKANVGLVQSLTQFNPIEYRFQELGANVTQAVGYPDSLPGRILGEYAGKALVVRWDWVPANYTLTVHLDAPKPLTKRIDPPAVGLPEGLQLIAQTMEHPFREAEWSNRFGYAVGNRLNGVVSFIDASGTYAVPTQYQPGS